MRLLDLRKSRWSARWLAYSATLQREVLGSHRHPGWKVRHRPTDSAGPHRTQQWCQRCAGVACGVRSDTCRTSGSHYSGTNPGDRSVSDRNKVCRAPPSGVHDRQCSRSRWRSDWSVGNTGSRSRRPSAPGILPVFASHPCWRSPIGAKRGTKYAKMWAPRPHDSVNRHRLIDRYGFMESSRFPGERTFLATLRHHRLTSNDAEGHRNRLRFRHRHLVC